MYNFIHYLAQVTISPDTLEGLPKGSPDNSISSILRIVFALAGGISVLIIVLAGLRMTTSSGNPDAVNKARNAIVFAIIGLVVCLTGFMIVTFVLNQF